jgi:glycosyltransferase involved in cell wall biosynthesis
VKNFNYEEFKCIELSTEEEIISGWLGDLSKPIISILCTTFNQQKYIEDAIRGFLIQVTDFPFEIIIHDDASTDETPNILKKYKNLYPNIIRLVLQNENQYSQGKKISSIVASYAKGGYLALCEGDDFWIDENKLSNQKKIVDANPDCSLVIHRCYLMNGGRVELEPAMGHGLSQRDVNISEVVSSAYQFSPTASYLIKKEIFNVLPDWIEKAPVGDYFLESYSFKLGRVIYTPSVSSVYRRWAEGSWTEDLNRTGEKLRGTSRRMCDSLELMRQDGFFDSNDIEKKISASLFGMAKGSLLDRDFIDFKSSIEKSFYMNKNLSLPQKLLFLLRHFPRLSRVVLLSYIRFT